MHERTITPISLPTGPGPDPVLINIKAASQMMGVTPATIYARLKAKVPGFPQPVRLSSRCTRFRRREVVAYVESLTGEAAT